VSLLLPAAPILVVAIGALLLMLAEAFGAPAKPAEAGEVVVDAGAGRSGELALGASVILFAGAIVSLAMWWAGAADANAPGLAPYLVMDRFSLFFCFTLCLGGALSALLAGGYLPEHGLDRGEFFPLILFSTVGSMALAAAGDLLTLFIALETMSLGVYCMIGLRRGSTRASEAALKYFLLGSFAAALLLFGGALLYGATGHTDLAGIGAALGPMLSQPSGGASALALAGLVLMLVGLAFKVSAVPFHMWTPDAYEGAPTPTTSFMAVAVKSAAFAVLVRVIITSFGSAELASFGTGWPPVLALLAVLSMTVANVIAGRQTSVKRMLAYSSIAHAGYALVGLVAAAGKPELAASVLYYMLAYTVSTAGAFGALVLCGSRGAEAVSYADLAGLGKRHPPAALAFSLFLFSLAGTPPTAGFFGKLYVFSAAVKAAPDNPMLYGLVVIGLLNSVVGAYYYLRVIVFMYMREPEPGAPIAKPMRSGYVGFALAVAAILVLALGIWPGSSLDVASAATLPGGP
jgi:NADH-quinone oxidoreductase subunit N